MTFCQQLRRGGDVLEGDRCRSGIDFISSRPIQHITTDGHHNPRKDLSSAKCPDRRLPQHSSPCSCSFRRFSQSSVTSSIASSPMTHYCPTKHSWLELPDWQTDRIFFSLSWIIKSHLVMSFLYATAVFIHHSAD